jgi:hypothetical protein
MTHEEMTTVAEKVLRDVLSRPVPLRFSEVVVDYPRSGSVIIRCELTGPADGDPARVIVKRTRDPDRHIFHEWASLEFVAAIPGIERRVPRLFGGDQTTEVSVMEDLGGEEDKLLGCILEGEDPERAESGLLAMNRALGRVQAETMGRDREFGEVRRRLPEAPISRHKVHRIQKALEDLPDRMTSIGVPLTSPALEDVRSAIEEVRSPGPFLAWSHGDWTPANGFYDPSPEGPEYRFFDLEASAWRHVLLDGTYARLRYLHSVWARQVPVDVQKKSAAVYRTELQQGCAAAGDDTRYTRAYLACAAGWLAGLLVFLPEVRDEDKRWGKSTYRQRIVTALDHFVVLAGELSGFQALAEASEKAAKCLRRSWPQTDCTMQVHRAFEGGR